MPLRLKFTTFHYILKEGDKVKEVKKKKTQHKAQYTQLEMLKWWYTQLKMCLMFE